MTDDLRRKAEAFRALHEGETAFVMPNAWDAGSARILADAGFAALGTTSAGSAFARGLPDYEDRLSRDEVLADCRRIAAAVPLPVSGDLEAGYGDTPEAVAETIRLSIDCGLVGGSIEDHRTDPAAPLYDIELAVERIAAAREAADKAPFPYTLTARAECYLVGHPRPFDEAVRRLNRYRAAGADCLYAPGITEAEAIAALVRAVDGPVNVVMGLVGRPLTVAQLTELGVRRISLGGSLARVAYGALVRAARELVEQGSFGFVGQAIPGKELMALFRRFDHAGEGR